MNILDISQLSVDDKKEAIKEHINYMNSMLATTPKTFYDISECELETLVNLVSRLIYSTHFFDIENNRNINVSLYKSSDAMKKSKYLFDLYSINNYGNVRCSQNTNYNYNLIIENRIKNIDNIIN